MAVTLVGKGEEEDRVLLRSLYMTMFCFYLFCFYRFISKTVESLTVRDARPTPSSAPAAAHVCSGEWFLILCHPSIKQPNEVEPGIHVFVSHVSAFWPKYDMVSFPGAGVSQSQPEPEVGQVHLEGLPPEASCSAQYTRGGRGVRFPQLCLGREASCSSRVLAQGRFARAVLNCFHSSGLNFLPLTSGQDRPETQASVCDCIHSSVLQTRSFFSLPFALFLPTLCF